MRLEYEGLSKCDAVVTKGARFFNDPAGFALERYAYYVCFKCKKAYYGGEVQCDADAGIGDEYNPVIIFSCATTFIITTIGVMTLSTKGLLGDTQYKRH
jgi:hypothetical protein